MALPNSPESWALLKRDMERTDIVKPLPDSMAAMHYLYNQQPNTKFQENLKYWEKEIDKITGIPDKLIHHALMYSTGIPTLKVKWETKMNIQEEDCRRCEEFNGEKDWCTSADFKPTVENGCTVFTPISGRDCRSCKEFNGKDQSCAPGHNACIFKDACFNFTPIQTSKPSPTVLVYHGGDKVIKGDKTLSLASIWSAHPCGDEFRKMNIVFTGKGYDFDDDIPFTQDNLDLLSDVAFNWLFSKDFFIEAEEEKPVYKVGQWFSRGDTPTKYLTIKVGNDRYMLLCVGRRPRPCSGGEKETMKELSDLIHAEWKDLTPIDPLVGV